MLCDKGNHTSKYDANYICDCVTAVIGNSVQRNLHPNTHLIYEITE